jgi:hypothetical protein
LSGAGFRDALAHAENAKLGEAIHALAIKA